MRRERKELKGSDWQWFHTVGRGYMERADRGGQIRAARRCVEEGAATFKRHKARYMDRNGSGGYGPNAI